MSKYSIFNNNQHIIELNNRQYVNHNLPSCKECNKPHSGVVFRGPLENQYAVCAMCWMRLEKESNKKRHRKIG